MTDEIYVIQVVLYPENTRDQRDKHGKYLYYFDALSFLLGSTRSAIKEGRAILADIKAGDYKHYTLMNAHTLPAGKYAAKLDIKRQSKDGDSLEYIHVQNELMELS